MRIIHFISSPRTLKLNCVSPSVINLLPVLLTSNTISFTADFDLSDNKLTQEFINTCSITLLNCPHLEEIYISCNRKQKLSLNLEKLFKTLGKMKDLKVVVISLYFDLSAELVFNLLKTCKQLRVFELPLYKINPFTTQFASEALLSAGALNTIALDFEESSEQAIGLILRELESHLHIRKISSSIPWKGEAPQDLIKYSQIEFLKFNMDYKIDSKFADIIVHAKNLRCLRIDQMKTKEIGLLVKVLIHNTTLESLTVGVIREWETYNEVAEFVKSNKKLKHLKLHGASPLLFKTEDTPSQNSIFEALKLNNTLQTLKLKGGAVNIAVVVKSIAKNTTLNTLIFKDVRMQSNSPKITMNTLIHSCKKLKSLSIIHPELPSMLMKELDGVKELFEIFNTSASFSEITFVNSLLNENNADRPLTTKQSPLNIAMISNTKLQKIFLQNIRIPSYYIKMILKGLIYCKHIRELRLENVGVNDDIANKVTELIINNEVIEYLSLAENLDMKIRGILVLLSALRITKRLSKLDLRGLSLSTEDKGILIIKLRKLISPTLIII